MESMKFAQQLQAEKDRLGFANIDLSEALDISPRTIDYWLKGERVPSVITQEGALARLKKCRKRT